MAKKIKAVKEFADGTMTKTAFFTFVRSALRKYSMYWKPISTCRNKAKRAYKGNNVRQKWEYQCNKCKKWYKGTEISVDHIIPAGALNSFEDIPQFVKVLFCDSTNLQVLCKTCHGKKTNKERKTKKK